MTPPALVKHVVRPLLPRAVRPRRIWRGPLRGTRIVASWHDYPAALLGYTEGPLLRWLSQNVKAGETWLDVGAHYGYTALALARLVGPSGRVFAFEPVPETAKCLSETCRLNGLDQVQVITMGLSDCTQVTQLEISLERGMAQSGATGEGRVSISLASLDRIWEQLAKGDERVHGVKLDVQGMDLHALQGMAALLAAQKPLLAVEFHHGVDRQAVLRFLAGCGYPGRGRPLEPLAGEQEPQYADDHTYAFSVTGVDPAQRDAVDKSALEM